MALASPSRTTRGNIAFRRYLSGEPDGTRAGLPATFFFDAAGRPADVHLGGLSRATRGLARQPSHFFLFFHASWSAPVMQPRKNALIASALLLSATAAHAAGDWPAPVRALEARGMEVLGRFDAPDGMTGYAAIVDQQPLSIYVTPDGKHAVVGPMVDAKGANLSEATLDKLAAAPVGERAWKQLAASTWIPDGRPVSRVVYAFTDPNCPYCGRFWKDARPWVESGKVQVRHVMVGILGPTSGPKAAAVLAAKDPGAALAEHEQGRGSGGGIKPLAKVDPAVQAKLDANQALMRQLGAAATPTIFYRDEKGVVRSVQGAPSPEMMAAVLGPR